MKDILVTAAKGAVIGGTMLIPGVRPLPIR